jgi:pimeloyl-ACP methyl ester carboxylesterase
MNYSFDPTRLIFIHGMESSSQGFKAKMLRERFPDMLIPDFRGSLEERMQSLDSILARNSGWTIIGSSLGGLMGAIFTCAPSNAGQVRKLILLAPALIWPDFAQNPPDPVYVPTVIYHGTRDDLIPLELLQPLAERVFTNLTFNSVDDDHRLGKTVQAIDWDELLQ